MLFKIAKRHIFIDANEFSDLEKLVLNGKTRHDFAREIYGKDVLWIDVWQEVMRKIYKMVEDLLIKAYSKDPDEFLSNYTKFEYVFDKAEKNVFDLLYAYCLTNKNAALSPIADTVATYLYTKQDIGSYSFVVIASKSRLSFNTKNKSWLQKLVDKRFDIEIEIPSWSVKHIHGKLNDFIVCFDDFIFHFGEFVKITHIPKADNQ